MWRWGLSSVRLVRAASDDVADAFRRRLGCCLRRMVVTARYLRSLASAVGVGSRVHLCLENECERRVFRSVRANRKVWNDECVLTEGRGASSRPHGTWKLGNAAKASSMIFLAYDFLLLRRERNLCASCRVGTDLGRVYSGCALERASFLLGFGSNS